MTKIKFRRGPETRLPILDEGEPGFTTDTKRFFIGSEVGDIELAKQCDLTTTNTNIASITASLLDIATAHVKSYGAKGDGITDDTTAIQAAINYVNSQGGGTVLLGKGTFKYTSLILYSNVLLKGMNPLVDSHTRTGSTNSLPTILYPTDTVNPSIKAYSNSSIDGICFFYKDQKTTLTSTSDDFIHYPATIQLGDRTNGIDYAFGISITNCILLGSYIFIEQSGVHCDKLTIKNIRGSVLNIFLHLKRMTDVSHVENVHINVNSLENFYDGDSNYVTKIAQTCVMFYLARCDDIVISDCFAFGVKNMVFFYQEADSYYADTGGGGGCTLIGTSADNVNQFLRVDRSMMSIGIRVIGGYCCPIVPVTGYEQAVVAYSVNANNNNVVFKGFRSFGTTYSAIPSSGSANYLVVFEDVNPTIAKNNICVLDGIYQDYLTALVKNENVLYLNTCMVSGLLNQRSMLQTEQLTINGNNGQILFDFGGIHQTFTRAGANYIAASATGSYIRVSTNGNGDNAYDIEYNNRNVKIGQYLTFGSIASLPTAGVAYEGTSVLVLGNGTSTADILYICLKSATGTYSWKQIMAG